LSLIAEGSNGARVNVSLDGQKIPVEVRGKDISEDKSGLTFFTARGPRIYEIVSRASRMREGPSKICFSTDSRDVKFWAAETLKYCAELGQ